MAKRARCQAGKADARWNHSQKYSDPKTHMETLTISVKHVASWDNKICGVCAAEFVPAEDSGSRVLSMKAQDQPGFSGLLCGGCYSKWSHGTTVALRPA